MNNSGPGMKKTILPPPDLRVIIDKTASFVAKNGREFEDRIMENERSNPKFSFLSLTDPYRPYYDTKVMDYKLGREDSSVATASTSSAVSTAIPTDDIRCSLGPSFSKQHIKGPSDSKLLQSPPMPVPSLDFLLPVDPIAALDLDIIKLTALFVAKNGRHFYTALQEKEHQNEQFAFLQHDHRLFSLFSRLVDQYSLMITNSDKHTALLNRIQHICKDKMFLLKAAQQRAEYFQYQKAQAKEDLLKEELERDQFMAVDWQEFSVVETLPISLEDYTLPLPPPINKQALVAMTLTQKKSQLKEKIAGSFVADSILEGNLKQDDMSMDIDDDNYMSPDAPIINAEPGFMQPQISFMNAEAANTTPGGANFVPRALQEIQKKNVNEESQICPQCQKAIPVSQLAEHIRIELLDPKWKQQREAYEKKFGSSNVITSGQAVSQYLAEMAKKRQDIFVNPESSSTIMNTIDSNHTSAEKSGISAIPKVIWDGSATSIEKTLTAKKITSHAQQLKEIAEAQAKVQEQLSKLTKLTPSSSFPSAPVPSVQSPPVPPAPMFPGLIPMGAPIVPPVPMIPSTFPGAFPPFIPPLAPIAHVKNHLFPDVSTSKIARLSPSVTKIMIKVPLDVSQNDWQLQGQTLEYGLNDSTGDVSEFSTSIEIVKEWICGQIGLPASRQKLAVEGSGMILKNSQKLSELAFPDTNMPVLVLSLKERGGKK